VAEEYELDFAARQALMGLILRVVDEVRFGLRALDVEELVDLARAWEDLNRGYTPTEVVLRLRKLND
jgi:hypothetical protein